VTITSARLAVTLIICGILLIVHALRRSGRTSYENGSFLFVILEMIAGVNCVAAGASVAIFAILSS